MSDRPGTLESVLLELRGVDKVFSQGPEEVVVLRDADLVLQAGEMVALVGPSGAGKSTLLHIAGLLERPTGGDVLLFGRSVAALGDADRSRLRRQKLGFVYQYHHLLPEFTAIENVMMPQLIAGVGRRAARARAKELLEAMGLGHRETHRPSKLSGGEQQRVAIARAVSNGPAILLADEPTGNLDQTTADIVFNQLGRLVHLARIGALVATHNMELAARMDRILRLDGGRLVEDKRPPR